MARQARKLASVPNTTSMTVEPNRLASRQPSVTATMYSGPKMGSRVNTPDGATIVGRDGFIWLENPPMPGKLEIQQPAGRCQIRLPASEPQAGPVNLGELSCL